jgi:hypothetical protein
MSYMEWVYLVFNICEKGLYDMARWLGTSYEELNILIFMVMHPLYSILVTVLLIRRGKSGSYSPSASDG